MPHTQGKNRGVGVAAQPSATSEKVAQLCLGAVCASALGEILSASRGTSPECNRDDKVNETSEADASFDTSYLERCCQLADFLDSGQGT
jgi:hypothetical protein